MVRGSTYDSGTGAPQSPVRCHLPKGYIVLTLFHGWGTRGPEKPRDLPKGMQLGRTLEA